MQLDYEFIALIFFGVLSVVLWLVLVGIMRTNNSRIEFLENAYDEKDHSLNIIKADYKDKLTDLQSQLKNIESEAEERVRKAEKHTRRITQLKTFDVSDAGFQQTIADVYLKAEVQFVLDCLERKLFNAAVMATDNDMVLNIIGKAKGVYLVKRALGEPLQINKEDEDE